MFVLKNILLNYNIPIDFFNWRKIYNNLRNIYTNANVVKSDEDLHICFKIKKHRFLIINFVYL